jgi:hypothetical protein
VSRKGECTLVGNEDDGVAGAVQNGATVPAIVEVAFEASTQRRSNVAVQVVGDFLPHLTT